MRVLENWDAAGRTQKSLIIKLIAVFLSIQIVLLSVFAVTLIVIDGTRAYTAGSEYYVIGQKTAAYSLMRYSKTGDPADFARFKEFLDIPQGDGAAHTNMRMDDLDWDAAREGLRRGRNLDSDIPFMILMYRLAGDTALMRPATEIWREADTLIAELALTGEQLHTAIEAGQSGSEIDDILDRIHILDARLTELEFDFAAAIGTIAIQIKTLSFIVIAALSTILWGVAIAAGLRIAAHADRNETALIRSQARFQDIADTAADWIWETDAEGRFTYLSRNAERLLNVDRDAILQGAGVADGLVALQDAFAKREAFRDLKVVRDRSEGGQRHFALRGKPVFDERGQFLGFRGTGTDVTQQVEAEHAILRAAVAANDANQAKTMFLANMSHELRTPLNAVIGFSEAMERQMFGAMNATYVEYAGIVRRSGEHLLSMLSDLLDISRISQGAINLETETVDVDAVIADSVRDALSAHSDQDRKIEIQMPPDVPHLDADKMRLRQIVTNLLTNALKFSEPPSVVHVAVVRQDRGLVIKVTDNGIGINPRDIARVMEPFVQAESGLERKRQGAGLGLPLVKQLVELHGGTFKLTSVPGEGTVAEVFLPESRILA
jgi:PAS domain S-box-containing protein